MIISVILGSQNDYIFARASVKEVPRFPTVPKTGNLEELILLNIIVSFFRITKEYFLIFY